jgi:hypothetical protein
MSIQLNIFGQVNDKTQILKSVLVDRPHGVVDEDTGSENSKSEYFDIVILVFV